MLGNWRDQITAFFKLHIANRRDEYMLIDATHLLSYSKEMEIAKPGYNKDHEFSPQVNLLFVYSSTLQHPVYYRIVPGDVREVKAFKLTLEESSIEDAVIIADKGFYSEGNVRQLETEGLRFIIPLRRSSSLIDYRPLEKPHKRGFQGYFRFKNRYIWYYAYEIDNRKIHCYLDEQLKNREEHDYLNRISTHPETYTIEEFHSKHSRFGTLAILTNLTEASSEEIYIHYKSRNNIEVMIDAMKNLLKADHSYMRNHTSLEGWMFITFIGLQCYYRIYKLLSEKQLLSKFSPRDILTHLAEIKKVKINGSWHTSEITNKTQKLMEKLGIHIT